MDDIQSWWEVPSIAHFCSLFRVAFNLLDFDIEELEEALLTDGAEDSGSSLLQELIVRLLCGCLGNNGISTFNYQMFLRRLFRQKCREYGKENPFNTDIDFQFLPLRTKVEILHSLCDFRLDAEDVMDVLKNLDSDSLRVHPLGYDENKSAYWYFYGTRLYREDYPHRAKKKKKKAREKKHGRKSRSESESEPEMGCGAWQVVCYTESDWERLAYKMDDSQCKEERALHTVLAEDFLPEIPRLFEEKERLQKKRLMEQQPRRQSSRIEKLKHQKEEEKKAQEQKDTVEKTEGKEKETRERERRDRDARRAREHRAMLRSRSHTNSECSSSSQTDNNGKPRGRQTNNSLSSATGQIIIQPSRQKLRTSQVFRQSVEDLQTGLYKILDRLKNHEDAWPFLDPVEEEYAPRYYSVIAKPMDLQRMEDKLDSGEYGSFSEFKADFQLIIDNCRQYNGSENEYTEMSGKLQEAFDAAVDRYLETEISTDEEVAVEFPGEQKGRRRKSSQASKHSPPPSHRSEESDNEIPEEPTKEESEVEGGEEEEGSPKDSESQSSQRSRSKLPTKSQETKRPGKKPTAIKNVTDIEALELATEQTLKDINKWLDDTPRFSEFSSASNSPSQLPIVDDCDGVGARIEHEYRARLKIRPKDKVDFTRRRFFKDHGAIKRRREIQRTIDRLQPGKSKGNLLSNPSASKHEETSNSGGLTGTKLKDQKVENSEKSDETTPKLSLGTVLNRDVIGFGKHSFENSDSEVMKKDDDSQDDSNDEKALLLEDNVKNSPENQENPPEEDVVSIKKAKEESSVSLNSFEKKTSQVQNSSKSEKSSTPNLSAWFKAFGLPKSQPPSKKKPDIVDETKEKLDQGKSTPKDSEEIISVDDEKDKKINVVPPLISPARRQRKASTGSSVSERSSFSQDPTDPMVDGSSPRPSLDEPYLSPQADPNKTPYHHSPLNGTIRVGFYQDTSFPRGSSDKSSSPREPPTPNCSPREPPSCSPRDIPSCSPRTPMASPKSDYPLYSASSLPYQSPSVNSYDSPLSPYPAHMSYYDTSKSLTDQYRSTQTATEKSVSSTYPVKKRIINEVEQSTRLSPDVSSYRGGSFTPTRNAIENDRSFTPTPGRIPTQPNVRPTYAPETALALGLHGISPHLMDPYAEERLLSAATYYGNEGIYGKNTPSTTSIHSMYPTSGSVMSNAGYPREDRGYSRIPTNFSETRPIKVSDSPALYSSSLSSSKTSTPVINYSGRSAELSSNAPRSSSPLNYSSHPNTNSKASTPPNISYVNRSQDSNQITEVPLDFAKVSQSETTKSKESSHVSYPTSRESLAPKVSSPYSRTVSDLSTSGISYNHSPDIVSGKLSVPLTYPSQQDILAGKVNYSHPMSDLARFGYPHSVSYNHPMSDLIQAKATSGTYSSRPVDLMTGGYNRPLGELIPGREVAYHQPVPRVSSTPKQSEPASKPTVKKPSKKRKSSDTTSPAAGIPAGFQQYLGQSSSEAISLKTSSVVPGSAFNFGPAPLKDSYTSYLDEMRSSNFFAPHPEMSASTKSSSPSPHPPASPFPYLSHAPSRPLSYPHPFMNYPQILQKDELLRPMVLHQGLLPPTGYPPPAGYLGIHDPINRSSWL